MQRVALQDLAEVNELAQLLRGRRQALCANDLVNGLAGGQVMANRADAAETLHDDGDVPVRTALDKTLESAKLDDVQSRFANNVVVISK